VIETTKFLHKDSVRPGLPSVVASDCLVEISKRFGSFELNVSFAIPSGITILFGPSGAGKTTLLDCIAGLTTPDAGRITVGSRSFFDDETGVPVGVRVKDRRVGYVLQDLALFPHLSVEKNIEYGIVGLPRGERQCRIDDLLESFRIGSLRRRKPQEISGGEQQRVALARSLVTDPCVLLLNEPLSALDAATKSKIVDDLRAWNLSHRIPIVYVTHSRNEVFALGERMLVLENGRIIAQGTPHKVMTAPRQETIAQLAGFENVYDATVVAAHQDRGTMTCRLAASDVELETPLVRTEVGAELRVGIRAGDVLLAIVRPEGISARNILPGRIISLAQRDVIVVGRVDCGVEMEVHLTLAARDALQLKPGSEVWMIVKTHSCHLMVG
jgi:molybdate transport system ATP-binding protein